MRFCAASRPWGSAWNGSAPTRNALPRLWRLTLVVRQVYYPALDGTEVLERILTPGLAGAMISIQLGRGFA